LVDLISGGFDLGDAILVVKIQPPELTFIVLGRIERRDAELFIGNAHCLLIDTRLVFWRLLLLHYGVHKHHRIIWHQELIESILILELLKLHHLVRVHIEGLLVPIARHYIFLHIGGVVWICLNLIK